MAPGAIIKNLYDKATCAVLFNGSTGDRSRTTVGVRQGCLLSPTLFNIYNHEKIMTDAFDNHEGTVRIVAEKPQTYFLLTTQMDWPARKNWKTSSKRWKQHQQLMAWISAQKKTKIMSNKADGFTKKNQDGRLQPFEIVTNFKYLGAIMTDEGSKRKCQQE